MATVTLQPSWYPALVELIFHNVIVDVEKADMCDMICKNQGSKQG